MLGRLKAATRRAAPGPSTATSTSSATARLKLAALLDAEVARDRAARSRGCSTRAGSRSSSSPTTAGSTCRAGCRRWSCPTTSPRQRKGRCARLKRTVRRPGLLTVPWFWDPARADGGRARHHHLRRRPVYDHGGVSPQECVTPGSRSRAAAAPALPPSRSSPSRGRAALRTCRSHGRAGGSRVDLRHKAGDARITLARVAAGRLEGGRHARSSSRTTS